MIEIGYLAALLGGALALFSPCSAMLLPAFFAYAFGTRGKLVTRTAVFYLGLATVLVPLGIGSSTVAGIFFRHRETLILVAGWAIIGLGVMQLAGKGFALMPGQRWMTRFTGDSPTSLFALGAASGLAGFCSGPILGGILTVAATSEQPATGGALLAVYALGMTAPLLLLALVWDRWRIGEQRWLRGRILSAGRFKVHSTTLISGLLFIGLGVLFLAFDGTAGLAGGPELTGIEGAAQEWVTEKLGSVPDSVVLLAAGSAALVVLVVRWLREGRHSRHLESVPPREGRR